MEAKRAVFLVVVVVAVAGCVDAACTNGYSALPDGTCVKLHDMVKLGDNRKTWEDSNALCETEGGTLISLDTPAKMEQFTAYVYGLGGDWSSYTHWVGAKKTSTAWRWNNGAELLLESNMWYPTAPDAAANSIYVFMAPYKTHERFYLMSGEAGDLSPVIACEK